MVEDPEQGIRGWLLIYLIASIPVLLFYSAALSGWILDYPRWIFVPIFILLALPLLSIVLKSPKAPYWNIAMLRLVTVLVNLRILFGVLFQSRLEDRPPLSDEEWLAAMPILLGVVFFSLIWLAVWTRYFKTSERVKRTFGE